MAFVVRLLLCWMLLQSTSFAALQPQEILPDPKLEQRARALSAGLRCLVCQNQSIDDSDAALAKDLRGLVREQLQSGKSDTEITNFIVARYGAYVLLKPPLTSHTLLLWLGPTLVFVIGMAGIMIAARRRKQAEIPPLSAEEQADLERALKD
jgi:cytochrome c-type biogenesis protein CcmH